MIETKQQPEATHVTERADRIDAVKRALIGRPRAGTEMGDTLLSKTLALPIFSADPLSSVAYATEAALVVLIGASATSGHLVLPISIAIAAVHADSPGVRDERRRLCRRQGEPRHAPEPRRRRRAAGRLRPHRRRLGRRRRARDHVRSAVAERP
jgi:hypothetical protein